MEWLEGEDLADRLKRGPLDVADVVSLGIRVASALSAAHALGIVHRDVKPSNIFLRNGQVGLATVLDFGVARPGWQGAASAATRTGALLGTLGYMAPEQAVGARSADSRADIFSLGCVLFECLTGAPLFPGAHAVEILANVLTLPIPHPRELRKEVPERLDALVLRMLSRDRAARPPDCDAVVAALEGRGGTVSRARRIRIALAVVSFALVAAGVALAPGLRATGSRREGEASPRGSVAPVASFPAPSTAPVPTVPLVTIPTAASPSASAPAASARPRPPRSAPSDDPFGTFRN
jgi:eukaryotic-like serine/threonine-protein kinase